MLDTQRNAPGAEEFHPVEEKEASFDRLTIKDIVEGKDARVPDIFRQLFRIALEKYPIFENVEFDFVPKDAEGYGAGQYDFADGKDGGPVPVILMKEASAEDMNELMTRRRKTVEMNARLLGLEVEDMPPELLHCFIVTHEFGHVYDYLSNYQSHLDGWDAVEEMDDHRDGMLDTLPASGLSPGQFIDVVNHMRSLDEVVEAFPGIENHPRWGEVSSIEDAVSLQDEEYRLIPAENFADDFAAKLMLENSEALGFADQVIQ